MTTNEKIERMEQIAQDTKKEFGYSKSTGKWFWVDRNERHNKDAYHDGFETRYKALEDAVEPYLTDSN